MKDFHFLVMLLLDHNLHGTYVNNIFLSIDRFSRPSIGGRSRPGARTTAAPEATSSAAPAVEEEVVAAKEVKPVSTGFARGRRKYLIQIDLILTTKLVILHKQTFINMYATLSFQTQHFNDL